MIVSQDSSNLLDRDFAVDGLGGVKPPESIRFSNRVNTSVLPESLPNKLNLEDSETESESQKPDNYKMNWALIIGVMIVAVFSSLALSK